jgi:uncharacterized protein (DUF58 family)
MRPMPRLVWLAGSFFALAFVAAFVDGGGGVWLALAAAAMGLAVVDGWRLRRGPVPQVERVSSRSVSIGHWSEVELRFTNDGRRALWLEAFDGVPATAEFDGLPRSFAVGAGETVSWTYRLRPLARGELVLAPADVLVASSWRLWARRVRLGKPSTIKVYPDFTAVLGLTLAAVEHRIQSMGIRTRARRGQGLDFHQLRDYQLGDTLRQVDWKATSRRRRIISREYQEERDQQFLFVVDCGRRMRSHAGGLSHFDHCLNALLLVTYIALRQGDAVGVLTFGGRDRWLPPRKGPATLNALLHGVYDLDTTLEPSDFTEVAARVRALQPRRALVIVLTTQHDEDEAELRAALSLLRARHLVVLASLREGSVEARIQAPATDLDAALSACAAVGFKAARARSLERLRGSHTLTLDVAPTDLAIALAERYLDIKRSGRL